MGRYGLRPRKKRPPLSPEPEQDEDDTVRVATPPKRRSRAPARTKAKSRPVPKRTKSNDVSQSKTKSKPPHEPAIEDEHQLSSPSPEDALNNAQVPEQSEVEDMEKEKDITAQQSGIIPSSDQHELMLEPTRSNKKDDGPRRTEIEGLETEQDIVTSDRKSCKRSTSKYVEEDDNGSEWESQSGSSEDQSDVDAEYEEAAEREADADFVLSKDEVSEARDESDEDAEAEAEADAEFELAEHEVLDNTPGEWDGSPPPTPPQTKRKKSKAASKRKTKSKGKAKSKAGEADDATVERLFKVLDAHGNGRITARDVQRVADDHGMFYTADELRDMVSFWDTAGTATVDLAAFKVLARDVGFAA